MPLDIIDISAPAIALQSINSFRSPRWPILNTLPATFASPAPRAKLYVLNAVLITGTASVPSGTTIALTVSECHFGSLAHQE